MEITHRDGSLWRAKNTAMHIDWSSWCAGGKGCCLAGFQQAGGMGLLEPHEVQWREVKSFLSLGQSNPDCNWLGKSFAEQDQRVLVDTKWKARQCALVAHKVNNILGHISKSAGSSLREVIIPFYGPLVRPKLDRHAQIGALQYKKDINELEEVQ